ncbi:ABC transporter permease [Actinomadura bangladeshensis]|uniref:ABC transporter permease n=1 Tax=Actinomadura bangladeshensis TaxID=453573 RepID=UPI001FB68568|nr:ABC transporter permease [Actinomadura bangladeshensis]
MSAAPAAGPLLALVLGSLAVVAAVLARLGVLLGGADPVEAGAVQLLVLIGLLAIESAAVLITLELVARGRIDRAGSYRRL